MLGGLSHFSGSVGLVCDNILEYEVVLASATTVWVMEKDQEHSDVFVLLFRALHGGSNNFGIVTGITFTAFRQGRLCCGTLIHLVESKDQQLQAF